MDRAESERLLAQLQHGRWAQALEQRSQLEDLEARLLETATWCATFVDPSAIASSLRPRHLAPRPLSTNRWSTVDQVVGWRRGELGMQRSLPRRRYLGRLLVCFPDADLTDGAAEAHSEGFFDVYNAPPWGTWVGYFEDGSGRQSDYGSYLLAWVPREVMALADAGVQVNPEACIQWLDESRVRLRGLFGDQRSIVLDPD